jgi:hypothetical protein
MGTITSIVHLIRQRAPGPAPAKSEVVQFPIDVFTEIHNGATGEVHCRSSKSTVRDMTDFIKATCRYNKNTEYAPEMNLGTIMYHNQVGDTIAITADKRVIQALSEAVYAQG